MMTRRSFFYSLNLILITQFFFPKAFSQEENYLDICQYSTTREFRLNLEDKKIVPSSVSKNHQDFNPIEKKLIHRTLRLHASGEELTQKDALRKFGDYGEYSDPNKVGTNAGEILTYENQELTLVLVHYWPGDTEMGAFFIKKATGNYTLKGKINDGDLECL